MRDFDRAYDRSGSCVDGARARCQCGHSVRRLFFRHGHLACRRCYKLAYASQQQDAITHKRLQASKLRLQLGGLPDITEPLPAKPKWIRRKRLTSALVIKSKRSRPKLQDASASQYQHRSSPITSDNPARSHHLTFHLRCAGEQLARGSA